MAVALRTTAAPLRYVRTATGAQGRDTALLRDYLPQESVSAAFDYEAVAVVRLVLGAFVIEMAAGGPEKAGFSDRGAEELQFGFKASIMTVECNEGRRVGAGFGAAERLQGFTRCSIRRGRRNSGHIFATSSAIGRPMSAGGLTFEAPEADMGCHPVDLSQRNVSGQHYISSYCDDIHRTVVELQGRAVEFIDEVEDRGYGWVLHFVMAGVCGWSCSSRSMRSGLSEGWIWGRGIPLKAVGQHIVGQETPRLLPLTGCDVWACYAVTYRYRHPGSDPGSSPGLCLCATDTQSVSVRPYHIYRIYPLNYPPITDYIVPVGQHVARRSGSEALRAEKPDLTTLTLMDGRSSTALRA